MKTQQPCQSSQSRPRPLVFLHVGDLHITSLRANAPKALKDRAKRLNADLHAIFADIRTIRPIGGFDFVYLPGDLAENAYVNEYKTLARVLGTDRQLDVRLIPGDHDRARGTMRDFENFRSGLTNQQKQEPIRFNQCVEAPLTTAPPPDGLRYGHVDQYFYHRDYRGVRCLFLDTVSAGCGQKGKGLDFRLGREQWKWLEEKICEAKVEVYRDEDGERRTGRPCAVFMHCYPADMHEPGDIADVTGLFWDGGVKLVEMGHTHYNEIAHDGRTQYATARSVGQNEDGPVGYAVVALDGNVTSWRFKQLQQTWPFVLITSPADRRLATEPLHVYDDGKILVRALILTDQPPTWNGQKPPELDDCEKPKLPDTSPLRYKAKCSVDGGEWKDMTYVGDNMFELCVDWRSGSKTVSVNVTDGRWQSRLQDFIDLDSIEPAAVEKDFVYKLKPEKPGSGAFAVPAWPVKGIRGDKLGPNSGGRKW